MMDVSYYCINYKIFDVKDSGTEHATFQMN